MTNLFITGTDTGVGKTIITGSIAAYLNQQGVDCGVMKPVESGLAFGAEGSDAFYLKKVSGVKDDLALINCYTLNEALAPGVAAEREGVSIDIDKIIQAYQKLTALHKTILVEGAGGLLVPLTKSKTMVDLIKELKLPVLLVGRLGLGTLNHTLLSLEYLKAKTIPVAGVILNTTDKNLDPSARLNPQTLQVWTDVPFWGVMDWVKDPHNPTELVEKLNRQITKSLKNYFII